MVRFKQYQQHGAAYPIRISSAAPIPKPLDLSQLGDGNGLRFVDRGERSSININRNIARLDNEADEVFISVLGVSGFIFVLCG